MTESDNGGCDDPSHDHSGEGFQSVSIGALFGGPSPHQRERAKMQAQSFTERIYGFIEGLDIEQLLMLRAILGLDGKSTSNNYFEGMVVSTLRLHHHADADTGITLESLKNDSPVTESGETPNTA